VVTYIIQFKEGRCANYDTTIVTLPPALFSPDTLVCASQTIDIKTTNIPGATYTWSQYVPNSTPGSINGADDAFQINVTSTSVNDDSTYFTVIVRDDLTCTSNDSVKVKTVPVINLTLENMNSCVGDSVTLDGDPGFTAPGAKYIWMYEGTPGSGRDTIGINPNPLITVKAAGIYYLDYVLGGCTASDNATVFFNPRPVLALSDSKHCFDPDAFPAPTDTLDAGTGPATDPYISYLWFTVPDTILEPKTDQRFVVHAPGKVYLTVTNANNCPSTDSMDVIDVCSPKFAIPQAFFPSKNTSGMDPDRYKDLTFRPFTKYVKNLQFTVFNRWGEVIFYTEDPTEGWDGTYRGELMPTGTYPWTCIYDPQDPDDAIGRRREKGAVTILKAEEE
jgi:gliding motility-associated-like protein